MKTIKLGLKKQPYNILVGDGILKTLGCKLKKMNIGEDAYIITNAFLKNKYGKKLKAALRRYGFSIRFKLIPDTEKSKSIGQAYSVIKDIAQYDKRRRIFIIAFGGGVIGDLAGFIASIYKRGLAYIQVPTTLLAQVDSSIGGKTAVDLMEGKNLVGAFYQPRLVFSDVEILKSLSLRQLRSGLAEVIKYAAIKDPLLFVYLEKKYKDILALKKSAVEFIVSRCSNIKANIVKRDEREERGIRTILNFGHTFGHAIEAAGGYKGYNHGEALALGMLLACDISRSLGIIREKPAQRLKALIAAMGLPTKIAKIKMAMIMKAYYYDKKFIGHKNRLVLLKDIGRTKIVTNVPLGIIKRALKKRIKN